MSEVELPVLLVEAFDDERELLAWTKALSDGLKREIETWVMRPVQEATRARRAEQMAEWLMSVMEAERELPGWVAQPLGSVAGAKQGWESWGVGVRRRWLFAVFGARTMETRERQVLRLVEAAAGRSQTKLKSKRR